MNRETNMAHFHFRAVFVTICTILLTLNGESFIKNDPIVLIFLYWFLLLSIVVFFTPKLQSQIASFLQNRHLPEYATQILSWILAFALTSTISILLSNMYEMNTPHSDAPENWRQNGWLFALWFIEEWFDQLPIFLCAGFGPNLLLKSLETSNFPFDSTSSLENTSERIDHQLEKTGLANRLKENSLNNPVAVQADEHYIKVFDDKKQMAHIKYRFGDALIELDALEGVQVHRSWWVQTQAIDELIKDNRKYQIRLKNGLVCPVSERYLSQIKQAIG